MKYSEFKRDVEAMGYSITNGKDDLYVRKGEHIYLISVGFRSTYTINSDYEYFRNLEDLEKERLLNLAWQLASTPLDEREDEKRYRLKLPFAMESGGYLNTYDDKFFVSSKTNVIDHKTIFTETEIAELKRKYNLDSFVLEGVKDETN